MFQTDSLVYIPQTILKSQNMTIFRPLTELNLWLLIVLLK